MQLAVWFSCRLLVQTSLTIFVAVIVVVVYLFACTQAVYIVQRLLVLSSLIRFVVCVWCSFVLAVRSCLLPVLTSRVHSLLLIAACCLVLVQTSRTDFSDHLRGLFVVFVRV